LCSDLSGCGGLGWLRLVRGRDIDGISLMNRLLKPFDGFPETFTQLGEFTCAENDQDNDQDQHQFHPSK
jgi:hypothetical protein